MMNKLMLNKDRIVACLILLCLCMAQACKKDILQPNSSILQSSLSIAEAKQYFDANLRKDTRPEKLMSTSAQQNTTLSEILGNKQPLWDKAYKKMISSGGAVKIPMDVGNTYAIVNKKTKAIVPFSALNYLLMYKDSLQNVHAEWVYLQPDSAWLYGNRGTYSGTILVRDWNGRFLKKFEYSGSNEVSTMKGIKPDKLSSLTGKPQTISTNPIITPFCVDVTYQVQKRCTCNAAQLALYGCDQCDICAGRKTETLCVWPTPNCVLCVDPPAVPPGSGGTAGTESGAGNNGGGSSDPNNYTPNCNPDPNYVMPDYPAPEGQDWIMPCGDVPTPIEPIDNGINPIPTNILFKQKSIVFNALAIRSVEEDLWIEEKLTTEELNEVSRIIFEQLTEVAYRNNELEIDNLSAFDEPPFWEKVKALFRRYIGIDQPKNIEEAQELDEMNSRYTVLYANIKSVRENNQMIFNFVPGYAALDALVTEQNYTSTAVNLSIDLFGGTLLKTVGSPLLKIGSKYLFKIPELAIKYPNITAKLRSFSISEFVVIKRTNTEKVIIIGEKMEERILPATKDVFKKIFKNAETFEPSKLAQDEFDDLIRSLGGRRLTDAEMRLTKVYKENVDWMIEKLNDGYNVIDIGPKIPGTIKSPSYGMERSFIYKK